MPVELSTREAYGRALVELGRSDDRVVVLDADLSRSTMTNLFARDFPQRFIECGLAEQNMIGIAAGLAASDKTAFASTFAVFAAGRCFDQVRMSVAQPGLNVKIVATHGGITVGEDGCSHHAVEDAALMCSLPNMSVLVPADGVETGLAVLAAAALNGPFYIRLGRPKICVVCGSEYRFTVGKATTMRPGKQVSIIATGIMVWEAWQAAERLSREGIECRVVNMSTWKPLDDEAIVAAARETGAIVTAEEHLEHGGLGSRVAQVVVGCHPVPMESVALKDVYAKSGKPEELLERYGLTSREVEAAVRRVLKRK